MFKLLIRLFVSLIFLSAGVILANPVTWTISGVTFSDGGTVSGSFVYDADAGPGGTYSSINITTAGGILIPGTPGTYTVVDHAVGCCSPFALTILPSGPINAPFTHVLTLLFKAPLTNAGGSIGISAVGEFVSSSDGSEGVPIRQISDVGSVTATPPPPPSTPAPSSVLLLATGLLAAFTWQMSRGWRRTRAQ
jgi:hypothetical protein